MGKLNFRKIGKFKGVKILRKLKVFRVFEKCHFEGGNSRRYKKGAYLNITSNIEICPLFISF
jgi:hypothetical protein